MMISKIDFLSEDFKFIDFHNGKVGDRKLLPVPYGEGFSDADLMPVLDSQGVKN